MTANAIETEGTKLEIGTGSGAAVTTVTAAVGFPTIITKATHGLENGDVVALSAFAGADAATMNGKTVVIKNVTTNTLAIDINTIGMTLTAANGTLTPVEWTEVGEITDFDGPGGGVTVIPKTNLQSTAVEKMVGLIDEGQYSFSINFYPDDTGQAACSAAKYAKTLNDFRLTYSDDTTQSFEGYVINLSASGAVDGKVNGTLTIEVTGEVTQA